MDLRSELLRGISTLPKFGSPGRIIVFGEKAEPVLTGPTEEQDIVMAAAQFEQGRIVIFSQDGYISEFRNSGPSDARLTQLHENIKQWVSSGNYVNKPGELINLSNAGSGLDYLTRAKIVVWSGGNKELIPFQAVQEFIRRGGGFVHGMTPWGWLQLNPGCTLDQMPYYSILKGVGLCYTEDCISDSVTEFIVSQNRASEAHLLRFLQTNATNPNEILKKAGLVQSLESIPKFALSKKVYTSVGSIWSTCCQKIQNSIPSSSNPTKTKDDRYLLDIWKMCVDVQGLMNVKAPGCENFPGDFPSPPPLKCSTVEQKSVRLDVFSTGFYAAPGQTVTVQVTSAIEDPSWFLLIGAHPDCLSGNNIRRWPNIQVRTKLDRTPIRISSPFGGLIYLQSPDKPNSSIKLSLTDIVEAPQFKLEEGASAVANWKSRRSAPGLWADILGKYVMITMPTKSVSNLDDPSEAVQIWDRVISIYHELRGSDVTQYRRMWIVTDEQPCAGYMHAGYPIVTHLDVADPKLDVFLFNTQVLKTIGNWGAFHEIGHNMQRPEWTFDGTLEVTCNIFTMYAMQTICGLKPWINAFLANQMSSAIKYLQTGANFVEWQNSAGIALVIYAQMIRDFGWETYKRVFRKYETMDAKQKPADSQQKIDEWFKNFSQAAGHSLTALTSFWGIPVSDAARQYMNQFPPYLPDDEATKAVQERTNSIVQKFPGIIRKSP